MRLPGQALLRTLFRKRAACSTGEPVEWVEPRRGGRVLVRWLEVDHSKEVEDDQIEWEADR